MKDDNQEGLRGMFKEYYDAIEGKKKGKPRKGIPYGLLKKVMVRSRGHCDNCGRDLMNVKIHIHHKNYEPTDDRESNLMVLCKPCHIRITGPAPIKNKLKEEEPEFEINWKKWGFEV